MPEETRSPTVYVIAGPNGAGKTTFASEFLPDFVTCREFLNADLIAAGLSPFAPESQNRRAGRLLLERINESASQRIDFGFETTLAGRSYATLLRALKHNGYRVILFFLWLPHAQLAVDRVASRVQQGGHSVPAEDVRRRYQIGIRNFFELYEPILDEWQLIDASLLPPALVAWKDPLNLSVIQLDLYKQIIFQTQERDEEHQSSIDD